MKQLRFYTTIVVTIGLLFVSSIGWCQQPMAGVDRNKIVIGEQIQLVLAIENAGSIPGWFNLPDSSNHIEVVERQKIDTIKIGNIVNYSQKITITSFDSGQWQIPALSIAGVAKTTQPIVIDVLPVDVSHMQDYNEIKDIVEVELSTPWIIIAALALLTVLALAIIYFMYQRKQRRVVVAPVLKGKQTPLEWALAELDKLQQQQLYLHKQVKQHYSTLTDIARSYFFLQLQHASLHQTTDEWMVSLQSVRADTEVKTSFFQLLRLAETVKFAKYIPPAEENEKSVDVARQIITNVGAAEAHAAYQPKAK